MQQNGGYPGMAPATSPTMPPTMPPNMAGMPPGRQMVQQQQAMVPLKKDYSGVIKTVAIVLLSLISVTFIGLFIWIFMQYNEVSENVDGQIAVAVAEAKDELTGQLEKEFAEREKLPYKTFSGPVDYGQLTFNYPKTWSVYVESDASNGGDFHAYFNPNQVDEVSEDTINALRASIVEKSFDDVAKEYQRVMDRPDSGLTVQATTVNGIPMNRYTGKIPNTDLNGFIVIFKIRDKTAILQTDSVLFENDYNALLETITFNA